ncbi:MAG TPA: BrnA antitoxin family protein [Thermoanaerobaculia bacterium]|jgi:uncharacterized protein (DUF4415 family)|nr:BrnA antitoxin family protein [Thermoanaerobaculia bacterium]
MSRSRSKATSDALPDDVSRLRGWRPARQVVDVTKTKLPTRRITINLDTDLVAIFKTEALQGGPPYQVAINQALRSYLRERERSRHERAAAIVLDALDDEAVRQKLRAMR